MTMVLYAFYISLAFLIAMSVSKWLSLSSGRPGVFSFLSRFDASVGALILRVNRIWISVTAITKISLKVLVRESWHVATTSVHRFLQTAERKVRAWREFARERKIDRKPASAFLNGVTEFKKELKQNGNHGSTQGL